MSTFMKRIREENSVIQEQIATVIGVSRPTYIDIENGRKILNLKQAQKLADFYGMTVQDLVEERIAPKPQVMLEKGKKSSGQAKERTIRISVPQNKVEKFKEVLLYILQEIGARANVGKAVLCKLLYFIDFDYYEKYEEQLMGATYIRTILVPHHRLFLIS